VLNQADRLDKYPSYAAATMREIGPVDAADVALPVSRLLAERTLAVKRGAEAWLLRHPRAALAGLEPGLAIAREQGNVTAALKVLAAAGHGDEIRSLLEDVPEKIKMVLGAAVSAAERASKKTKAPAKAPSYRHIGWVYYRAHHASPLVLGDLDVMKDWQGSAEGSDFGQVALPKGKVITVDLALEAPDVFLSASEEEIVLMAGGGTGRSLCKDHEASMLEAELAKPFKKKAQTLPLEVRSGAIVISIAYNATPAKGARVDHLDDARFATDTPRLPKAAPKAPLYAEELIVVPVPNGRYEVVVGASGTLMKCVIRRSTRQSGATKRKAR
jgi:hypothetical protein